MRILLVASSFYPTISPRAFRATELAKELSKQGHLIKVIVCENDFDYKTFKEGHNIDIETYKCSWPKYLQIWGNLNSLHNRILNRLVLLLFEYPSVEIMFRIAKILKNESQYDALISIAVPYPVHWGVTKALRVNKNLCKTWIADCGDPYMGSNKFTNKYNRHPFYFKYIEKWAFRKANYITVPTEKAIWGFFSEFHFKIRVIPQGFNFNETGIASKLKNGEVLTFGYAGGFNPLYRDPRPFLNYLTTKTIDFKFIIYTDPNGFDLITPFRDRLDNKLEIHDLIPRDQLFLKLSQTDFLVNIENIMEIQTPSKLIDYALMKRPILSINSRKMNKMIIDEFLNREYKNQFVVENIEQYNIRNVAQSFCLLINSDQV